MARYMSNFVTSGSLFVNPTDDSINVADLDILVIYIHALHQVAIYMSDFVTSGTIYVNPCESWIQNGEGCCWLWLC